MVLGLFGKYLMHWNFLTVLSLAVLNIFYFVVGVDLSLLIHILMVLVQLCWAVYLAPLCIGIRCSTLKLIRIMV